MSRTNPARRPWAGFFVGLARRRLLGLDHPHLIAV